MTICKGAIGDDVLKECKLKMEQRKLKPKSEKEEKLEAAVRTPKASQLGKNVGKEKGID